MQWWYEKIYIFCVVFKIKVIEVGGGDLQSKISALLEIFLSVGDMKNFCLMLTFLLKSHLG